MIKVNQYLRDNIYNHLDTILNSVEDSFDLLQSRYVVSLLQNKDEDNNLFSTDTNFRVSKLVSCPRKEYFRIKGEKETYSTKSYLSLIMGTDIHRRIQTILDDVLISKEQQLILNRGDYSIVGHYDGIVNFDDKNIFFEIKTMSPFAFQKVLKEIADVEKDYSKLNKEMIIHSYLSQANFYLYLYKTLVKEPEINENCLIFVNKASVKGIDPIFSLQFDYDENLVNKILEQADYIYNCVKNNSMPNPTSNIWECRYCFYKNCDLNNNKDIENGQEKECVEI